MSSNQMLSVRPLRFEPSFEIPEPDEAETARELVETMRAIMETTYKHYGHAVRSVHAKSHGLLTGEIEVSGDLPPELAQGIFARTGRFPVVMRYSTIPGDILDDSITVPRGLAVKVVGVEGERLEGSEETSQDFLMVDGPAFGAPDAKSFLKNLKLLAKTTDTPQVLKKVISAVFRGAERLVEAAGSQSPTLVSMGGHANTNLLGATYYTQAPILYGDYVAKLSVAPVSPGLVALADKPVSGRANALREAVMEHFVAHGGEWEVRVQLMTDRKTMPIEDSSVPWPEDESPYIAVARIVAPPQEAWSDGRSAKVDDAMAFSAWNGIAAHRPLGSIMRCRKPSYEMSSAFRAGHNGCPILHPRAAADIAL